MMREDLTKLKSNASYKVEDEQRLEESLSSKVPTPLAATSVTSAADEGEGSHYIDSLRSLKTRLKALERALAENENQRFKYGDQPAQFLASETALDAEVRAFEDLGAFPELVLHFHRLGGTQILASLLAHANLDIAAAAAETIAELTEPDVLSQISGSPTAVASDTATPSISGGEDLLNELIGQYDIFALIAENVERSQEAKIEDDFKCVYVHLQVVSNLCETVPVTAVPEILKNRRLLNWMLSRLSRSVGGRLSDENCLYCAEIIAVILQNSDQAKQEIPPANGPFNGLEKLLVALNRFRKVKDPREDEQECCLNLKDSIVACLLHAANRELFGPLEGIQLMVRLLSEHQLSLQIGVAVEILSLATLQNSTNCQTFIQSGGLRYLFLLLYKFAERASATMSGRKSAQLLESGLSICLNLVTNCTGTEQARLIAKFFENDCEKLAFLISLHLFWLRRANAIDSEVQTDTDWQPRRDYSQSVLGLAPLGEDEEEEEIYLDRCEAGLIILQLVDRIILRLSQAGRSILTIQVHMFLDGELSVGSASEGVTKLMSLARVLREYGDHIPDDNERETFLKRLELFVEEHVEMMSLGQSYTEQALKKGEELRAENEKERKVAQVEQRRKRRKIAKFREKLRKMDRELEERENLEQYRYDRKHGNLLPF